MAWGAKKIAGAKFIAPEIVVYTRSYLGSHIVVKLICTGTRLAKVFVINSLSACENVFLYSLIGEKDGWRECGIQIALSIGNVKPCGVT